MRCSVTAFLYLAVHITVCIHAALARTTFATVGAHGETTPSHSSIHEVTVADATKAAIAAASEVAQVAAVLDAQKMPAAVREAALKAASAAAARSALEGDSTPNLAAGAASAPTFSAPEGNAARSPAVMRREALPEALPAAPEPKKAVNVKSPAPEIDVLNRWQQPTPLARPMAGTWNLQLVGQQMAAPQPVARQAMGPQSMPAPQPNEAENLGMSRQPEAGFGQPMLTPQPVLQRKPEKLLYIGVFSEPREFDKRMAARQGWMAALRRQFQNSDEVRAEFVIGRRPVKASAPPEGEVRTGSSLLEVSEARSPGALGDPWATPSPQSMGQLADGTAPSVDAGEVQLDMALGREFSEHGDMLHIPYEDLPIRVLMFFAHAADTDYRFVLKVHVDHEFLFMPIVSSLRQERPEALLYAGQELLSDGHSSSGSLEGATQGAGPQSPAFIDESNDAMVQELGPFLKKSKSYFAGSCYLASQPLARMIAKNHLDHSLMLWSYNSDVRGTAASTIDDVDMGQWVAWEDELLAAKQNSTDSRNNHSSSAADARVRYRSMELCRSGYGVDVAPVPQASQQYPSSPYGPRLAPAYSMSGQAPNVAPFSTPPEAYIMNQPPQYQVPQYFPSVQEPYAAAFPQAAAADPWGQPPVYSAIGRSPYNVAMQQAPENYAMPRSQENAYALAAQMPQQEPMQRSLETYAMPQSQTNAYAPASQTAAEAYNRAFASTEQGRPRGIMPHPLDSAEGFLPSPEPPSSYELPPASEDVAAGFRG